MVSNIFFGSLFIGGYSYLIYKGYESYKEVRKYEEKNLKDK